MEVCGVVDRNGERFIESEHDDGGTSNVKRAIVNEVGDD